MIHSKIDGNGTDQLRSFETQSRTRLVFGPGALNQLRELISALGGHRVLIVTDPGIVAAGHLSATQDILQGGNIETFVYQDVRENPTTQDVAACVQVATAARIDLIVGLGGGSSMDTAKGCNFIYTNGGRMQDYWGKGKATKPMLPMIAIPTTSGTGSECQSFALIADESTHQKMACGDPKAAPAVALLDPGLTISQPASVTACTGIDALAHALETAVTRERTPYSGMYSLQAFKWLWTHFARVLDRPEDGVARGYMQLGAAFAGTAIEHSMLGAVHAAANPLTARFGVVHGQAVGVMMPHVVAWNAQDPEVARVYAQFVTASEIASPGGGVTGTVQILVQRLRGLLEEAGLPCTLTAHGVSEAMLPALAQEAATQWTGQFNPRPVSEADFLELYRAAL